MMEKPIIAWLFPNGMVCSCGKDDQQIPGLQGRYNIILHKKILKLNPQCKMKGFPEL